MSLTMKMSESARRAGVIDPLLISMSLAEIGGSLSAAANVEYVPLKLEASDAWFELGAGIPPSGSTTVTLQTNAAHRWISVAGMLVSSNDAFYAVQGLRTTRATVTDYAIAWDSGSEAAIGPRYVSSHS